MFVYSVANIDTLAYGDPLSETIREQNNKNYERHQSWINVLHAYHKITYEIRQREYHGK